MHAIVMRYYAIVMCYWRSPARAMLVASLSILLVAGCGDDANKPSPGRSDQALVRETVVAWYSAIARADGSRACALMTPAYREELAEDGPAFIVTPDGELIRRPRSCSRRISAGSEKLIVGSGIAADVDGADVTKVDVLNDHATTVAKLGKGNHVLALAKVDGRWLVSGALRR
jgi:hypothetical protein